MPIDKPTDPATATSRRTFLTRTALGGLVTAGVVASPIGPFSGTAGAQEDTAGSVGPDKMTDAAYVAYAVPLELAAVLAYQTAVDTDLLTTDWTNVARSFQTHHQTVADSFSPYAAADAPPLSANPIFLKASNDAVGASGDEKALLIALSTMEQQLSASHLLALSAITDGTTARNVAQVLTVETQQGVVLSMGADVAVDALTPAVATTEDAAAFQATS